MIERELKYSSPDDNIPILSELEPIFIDYKISPAKLYQIHDRYYDDATNSLEKAGIGLRKRKINSKRLVTLKSNAQNQEEYFERKELEGICNVSALRRIIEFRTERVSYTVSQAKPLAIISFDRITAKLANIDKKTSFFEVEIEAIAGTSQSKLLIIAQTLEKVISLSANTSNKLARAKALLSLGEFL